MIRRAALGLPALALAAFASAACAATTYYVRTDGGSAEQCSGKADAAYPGSGAGKACAWSHPFIALPPTSPEHPVAPRIAGGDTLIIGAGEYVMGLGATPEGSPEMRACWSGYATDCHMQPVPPGPDAAHKTRVLGAGWDRGCPKPPTLWGTRGEYVIVDLSGSSNSVVGCLELTDRSSCIQNHCRLGNCKGDAQQIDRCPDNEGTWARTGLMSTDAHEVELFDLNIHGLSEGVHAGRIKDWNVERVRLWANSFAGWDGDVSNGGSASASNSGTLRFRQLEIAWSGCGERYPGGEIFGCWGQEEGGYGDGFSTGRSGGRWLFEDSHVHHNTQDGLDLLYLDASGAVTMRRVRAEANAGNQLKASGNVTIADSVVDGNCAAFRGVGNMQEGDQCRAQGGAIAIALMDGKRSVVENSQVSGEGGCLIVGSGGGKDALMVLRGNTLTGRPRWDDKNTLACGYYLYESGGRVEASGNRISNVKASSTLRESCANQAADSLLGGACRKLKQWYRALRGAAPINAIARG